MRRLLLDRAVLSARSCSSFNLPLLVSENADVFRHQDSQRISNFSDVIFTGGFQAARKTLNRDVPVSFQLLVGGARYMLQHLLAGELAHGDQL
jgi:hypothetical protein